MASYFNVTLLLLLCMYSITVYSSQNMGGLWKQFLKYERIIYWTFYWMIQRNTGRKNGIKVRVFMEGACKSVQLHNIGSMCMTALPTQISLVYSSFKTFLDYKWIPYRYLAIFTFNIITFWIYCRINSVMEHTSSELS